MKRLLPILVCCLFAADDSDARTKREKAACDEVKVQIRNIESKMRAGYTRAQGERYEAALRKLKAKRYRLCR